MEMFSVINVITGSKEFFIHVKELCVAALCGSGPNLTLKCDVKEMYACLLSCWRASYYWLYSSLLLCSSAQLDSEDQWCTRSHWGKCLLGVPCEREAKALLPLAEGWWTTTASGRCSHSAYDFMTIGDGSDGSTLKSPSFVGNSLSCLVGASVWGWVPELEKRGMPHSFSWVGFRELLMTPRMHDSFKVPPRNERSTNPTDLRVDMHVKKW